MDATIRKDMDAIKAIADRYHLLYKEWEDERGWMCEIGRTSAVCGTIYWYTIDMDGTALVCHKGTTKGCFWTEWEPVED